MINPNICKRVLVDVIKNTKGFKVGVYNNHQIRLHDDDVALGKRRLYLKYSIMTDSYYLSKKG